MSAPPQVDLRPALEHLARVTAGAVEVVIVEEDTAVLRGVEMHWPWGPILTVPAEGSLDPVIAVNVGVEHATADTVVVLDGRTRPEPGWLDGLLAPLSGGAAVVVGAVPCDPKTAGLLVFADASVAPGPVSEPGPTVEVDAVDGTCVAMRTAAWHAHRGLDARYSMPGLAMVDLCFRLRATGFTVVAATGARVASPPLPAPPERDRLRFRDQWAAVLTAHEPAPGAGGELPADADRRTRPVGAPARRRRSAPHTGTTVLVLGPMPSNAPGGGGPAADRAQRIYNLFGDVGCEMFDAAAGTAPDLVWFVSEPTLRAQIVAARRLWPEALLVADAVAVESARAERLGALLGRPPSAESTRLRQREQLWYGLADVVVASTSADRTALSALVPDVIVELLPDPVAPGPAVTPGDREGVLWWADFTEEHNVDAAHWLCREVLPRAQTGRRVTPAFLAGPGAGAALTSLVGRGVTLSDGDDVAPHAARARLVACPLRHGSGAAVRAALGAAAGLALVGTSLGIDAAGLTPGVGAWAADDADGLARAIIDLHRDDDAWSAMSHAAQDQLARRRPAATSLLLQLLRR
ncbi:MAG: glycosyltransferase [Acidimicrobiales bacterium]